MSENIIKFCCISDKYKPFELIQDFKKELSNGKIRFEMLESKASTKRSGKSKRAKHVLSENCFDVRINQTLINATDKLNNKIKEYVIFEAKTITLYKFTR